MTTKDEVAQLIVGEAKARAHTRDECLGELSALYQESGWDETIWDPTHTTYGVAQQDGSYPNRFDGAAAQLKAFFDKLDAKRTSPGHGDIWLNICWLQQAPNWPSAKYWWDHGRQAYLTEIKSRIATVTPYLDKYWPSTGGAQPVTDPNRPDYNEFPIWCDNNQDRGSTKIDLFLLHTQEGGGGNSAAEDLANFLVSTTGGSNPVSYHYCISQASDGGVTVVDCVDTDQASWAVGNSNNRTINLCFAGSASAWTRDQWMQQANAIDVAAYLAVQDCIKYGIPTRVLVPYAAPGGIADHRYCTNFLKDGNNHTDVGGPLQPPWTGFPWDVFAAAVDKYANPSEVPPVTQPPVTPPASDPFVDMLNNGTDRQVLNYIAAQLGPGEPLWPSKGMTLRDKLWSLVTPAAKAARKPKTTP